MDPLKTHRTTVKRSPSRGRYEMADLYSVLDATYVCHVGFTDHGTPMVIPTAFGRDDQYIYLHGATSSRMIRRLLESDSCCITITLLDGLVLARSVFHHSMNYRSAVILGKAENLEGEEKTKGLEIITEHILKGRWSEARVPNEKELKATTVVRIPLAEGSVKVRTGPPKDEEEDYNLDIWAGVLPLELNYGKPVDDPDLSDGISLPESVKNLKK